MPARSPHADLVPTARRWTRSLYRLRDRIFDGLGAEATTLLDEAAFALDLAIDDELVLETSVALPVIADYALYHVRRGGRNAIERYRDLRRPAQESKDGRLLAAMIAARCSVYQVSEIEPEVGVGLVDLLGGLPRFVVDPDVVALAEEGIAYVARLADLGEVMVTAGPLLPLGEIEAEVMRADLATSLPGRDPARLVDLTAAEKAALEGRLWQVAVDISIAAIAGLLEEAAPEPVVASPRLWLPGEPYELPDLRYAGRAASGPAGASRLRALPPAPLIVPSRPSLVPVPPALPIQRAEPPRGEHRVNLPTYLALRRTAAEVQNEVVKTLTKEEFNESGARLGILQGDVLVLDSEHEMAVLADFAIYDVRLDGRSPIERYLEERRATLKDEERAVLEAMIAHRYGIIMVEGKEPGVGVAATDLLGGPPFFLYDVNLSQTGQSGLVLATRLIAPAGLTMTTGAALPLLGVAGDPDRIVDRFAGGDLAPLRNIPEEQHADFNETIIRLALEQAGGATFQTRDAANPLGPRDATGLFGSARPLPRARGKVRPDSLPPKPGRPRKRRR